MGAKAMLLREIQETRRVVRGAEVVRIRVATDASPGAPVVWLITSAHAERRDFELVVHPDDWSTLLIEASPHIDLRVGDVRGGVTHLWGIPVVPVAA